MTLLELPAACGKDCACHTHQINRRDFLALTGVTALAGMIGSLPVMAGPFEAPDFATLIPPDKKLRPDWVKSLYARGKPTIYSKKRKELDFIGMPVGGLCCGTVYLGGDGRLWAWDIFNQVHEGVLPGDVDARDGSNYVKPHREQAPFAQGFALKVNGVVRSLDVSGWENITFEGQYPIGTVRYSELASPVAVTLTAYSPFIPLNADDSSLPVAVCEFTLENTSTSVVEAEIGGWMQNAARLFSGANTPGRRVNTITTAEGATTLLCAFDETAAPPTIARPDILMDDFQHATYRNWKTEGTAFGSGPIARTDVPAYQGDLGRTGDRVVNSHASAPGTTIAEKDAQTGTLTSPPFTIERNFLSFTIGGGSNVDEVGLALVVNGHPVRRASGRNENRMHLASFPISEFAGKEAVIQIYDRATGAWGNIGVGQIVQTDTPSPDPAASLDGDFGTMALMLLGAGTGKASALPNGVFDAAPLNTAHEEVGSALIGAITQTVKLAPGAAQTVTFAVAWHFPHPGPLPVKDASEGNYYAKRFADASAVAHYVADNYPRLSHATKLWRETWYDSTLPHWFLDRTFANTCILATSTAHRFGTGRFWGWEGVGCCEGTCIHVYHYAQAIGRIFPEIERDQRERVDFGLAFDKNTGQIGYRGEGTGPAVDGQCGRILGVCREHRMSADDSFLRRLWPSVKRGMDWVSRHDTDGDGLLEGAQDNTLDAAWYGKIPWINSLYAAALRACEVMATDMGDTAYAAQCLAKLKVTRNALETKLFDGEYFVQLPEAGHEHSLGVYQTCHIDQVQGQSWAWQAGLGRILDEGKTVSALKSLYQYNFAPDVGPFKAKNTAGRPYALAGEGGLIMATNPRSLPEPFGVVGWQTMYFNECMSGFEHQAASHMIAEGMVLEGLTVTRAIHDRYHAAKRNPYNEVECSDHYARAMASYGSFVSICGFAYHGPNGSLAFAPRLTPEDFRAPFVVAEGWGTFAQQITGGVLTAHITLQYGQLRLTTLGLTPRSSADHVHAEAAEKPLPAALKKGVDGQAHITLARPLTLKTGQTLTVRLT